MLYWEAQEAMPIAEEIIGLHHPHLATAKIGYLFREKAKKRGDLVTWGTASKFPSKYQAFFDQPAGDAIPGVVADPKDKPKFVFLIELAWDVWQTLTEAKRAALLDHELSHCWGEEGDGGEMKWSILPHDFEEFGDVIRRHGLYHESLVDAKKVLSTAV